MYKHTGLSVKLKQQQQQQQQQQHTHTRTHARTQVAEPLWSDLAKEWNWCARAELHFKKKRWREMICATAP